MSYTKEIIDKLKCPFKAEDLRIDTGRIIDGTGEVLREFFVRVKHVPTSEGVYMRGALPQKELLEHALYELKERLPE